MKMYKLKPLAQKCFCVRDCIHIDIKHTLVHERR